MEVPVINGGQALLNLVEDMRALHVQISGLLGSADETLREHGWNPAIGSTCSAYGSASLYNPRQWTPSEFFRFHRNPRHRGALAFVAVVLLPPAGDDQQLINLSEPVATSGWFDYPEDQAVTVSNQWHCRWHLYGQALRDGSIVETRRSDLPPAEISKFSYGFERARSFAVPLVEIINTSSLNERVVMPLIRDVQEQRSRT